MKPLLVLLPLLLAAWAPADVNLGDRLTVRQQRHLETVLDSIFREQEARALAARCRQQPNYRKCRRPE